ncbi:MAG: Fic family protein [Verrucomicrobia bacterium]|nr:Fic family protein [Verrucomicrobiota bacterium]
MKLFNFSPATPPSIDKSLTQTIQCQAQQSSSFAITKYLPVLNRHFMPGIWVAPNGLYARTTTKEQHENFIASPDFEPDTQWLYSRIVSSLSNFPKDELQRYLGPIEDAEQGVYYSGSQQFPSLAKASTNEVQKEKFQDLIEKTEIGSQDHHRIELEDSNYLARTCNGIEETRINSYVGKQKRQEDALGYLDYQMTTKDFWSLSEDEILEVIRKTHRLLGKNSQGNYNLGKFRDPKAQSIVLSERFSSISESKGLDEAIRRCMPDATQREIGIILHALDSSSSHVRSPEEKQILERYFHIPPPSSQVDEKMKELAQKLKRSAISKEKDPIDLACAAHQGLTELHPFPDGNGRTARILMNAILLRAEKPPAVFIDEDDYINAVRKGDAVFRQEVVKGMERSEKYRSSYTKPPIKRIPTFWDQLDTPSPAAQSAIDYLESKEIYGNARKIYALNIHKE